MRSATSEQRQATVAVLVALFACTIVSSTAANLISGVSFVAATVTSALSFYAMFAFGLHLATGLMLERPPMVRRMQALLVLCVTALSAWALVLHHGSPFVRGVIAVAPGCVLAGLIFGPWRGLLPASKATREKQLSKEKEGSNE